VTLMAWDAQKFDVLVPKMNEQHHKLIDMMNTLYGRAEAKAPKAELQKLLNQLHDYTVMHFREEEALLDQMSFPGATRHKSIHGQLLADFGTHLDAFNKGPGTLSHAFFDFLRLWLSSHIMHIDRKYGEHSRQQGAT
jgi:hemerythrin